MKKPPYEDSPVYTYVRDFKVQLPDQSSVAHDDPITCMAMEEFLGRVRRDHAIMGEFRSPIREEWMNDDQWKVRCLEIHVDYIGVLIFDGEYSLDGVLTLYWQPHYAIPIKDIDSCTLAPRLFCEPVEMMDQVRVIRIPTCDLMLKPVEKADG